MIVLRAVTMLIALVLFSGTGVFSQEKKDSAKEPPKETKEIGKAKGQLPPNWSKLGLSDQQKQEVYKTRAKYSDQIKKLQEQIDGLKADEKKDLDKILTSEQKKRLVEIVTGEPSK